MTIFLMSKYVWYLFWIVYYGLKTIFIIIKKAKLTEIIW